MRKLFLLLGMTLFATQGRAQQTFDDFRKVIREEFNNFRKECMDEFTDFVRNPWKEFEEEKPTPLPKDDQKPPVVMPIEDRNKTVDNRPVIIDEVIPIIHEEPQPTPIEPIQEQPINEDKYIIFSFYGTTEKVRFDTADMINLHGIDENSVADALASFSAEAFDNMIADCLSIREKLHLCDWAYLQMLKSLANAIGGEYTNQATLLMAYLYMQSGYKMRLASNGNRLYMLFASKHHIYERPYFHIGDENYFGVDDLPKQLYVCQAAFPKERNMSLYVPQSQRFQNSKSAVRTVTSKGYPSMSVEVSVNKNLIDFYRFISDFC